MRQKLPHEIVEIIMHFAGAYAWDEKQRPYIAEIRSIGDVASYGVPVPPAFEGDPCIAGCVLPLRRGLAAGLGRVPFTGLKQVSQTSQMSF